MKNSRRRESVVSDREAMELAIRVALDGVKKRQAPFGCTIAGPGDLLVSQHNTVWDAQDPTAHAEVNAIREACQRLGTFDLSGSVLYATCEPCPMCFSAAHWARVRRIVFGATIEDARAAGFSELVIPPETMKRIAGNAVLLVPGFMAEECREVFRAWKRLGRGRPY